MKNFVSTLFAGVLVGILIFGLSGGVVLGEKRSGNPSNGSVEVEDTTKVQWKFDSESCTVAIDVHGNKNLPRKQDLDPGSALIWSDYFGDMTVNTESNCTSGYTVSVYPSNTHPNTVDVLEDFSLAARKGVTNADPQKVSIELPNPDDWNYFSGEGSTNDLDLGQVDESDDSGNLNHVDGTEWIMDYRYEMDSDDVLNEEYYVELTYVVSTK